MCTVLQRDVASVFSQIPNFTPVYDGVRNLLVRFQAFAHKLSTFRSLGHFASANVCVLAHMHTLGVIIYFDFAHVGALAHLRV